MTNRDPKFNFLGQLFKKRHNIQEPVHQDAENQAKNTLLDYYISLVQNHPDFILVFSLEGKVVSHNKRSINEHLGYRPKQKIAFKDLVSEKRYVLLQLAFQKAAQGITEQVEFAAYNKRGEKLYITGSFIPIVPTPNRIEGVILILKDSTT